MHACRSVESVTSEGPMVRIVDIIALPAPTLPRLWPGMLSLSGNATSLSCSWGHECVQLPTGMGTSWGWAFVLFKLFSQMDVGFLTSIVDCFIKHFKTYHSTWLMSQALFWLILFFVFISFSSSFLLKEGWFFIYLKPSVNRYHTTLF